jgi:hypothetical protein
MEIYGSFAFGAVLGWFLYFTNRYRKGDTQLSDVATLLGVIGGGAATALFGDAKTTLFAAYGLGLAAGFFAYFIVLIVMVNMSGGAFGVTWFLDVRRRKPKDNEIIPEGTRITTAPMSGRPPGSGVHPNAAPAPAAVEVALDLVAERDAAIGATNDALRGIRERLNNEADQNERGKLFEAEHALTDRLEQLVTLRIRASLDSREVHDALAELGQITEAMKEGAAQMRTTAEALAQAAKVIGLASKVIGIVSNFV